MNFDCGIYAITSPSGKQYIGQASSFRARWAQHRSDLIKGRHHCLALQNAYRKYGLIDLVFSKIAIVAIEQLDFREQEQIDSRDRSKLYNTAICVVAPNRGIKLSKKVRARFSAAKIGDKNPQWGKPISEEARRKISETLKARNASRTHKKAMSAITRAKIGARKKGQLHSAASKEKMSMSHKGKLISKEQREKLSIALKGRTFTPEWREKISMSLTGRKISDHHKAILKAAASGENSRVARAVICVELEKTFMTIAAAVEFLRVNGKPRATTTSISGACSGKAKSAYGYTWRYLQRGEVDAATQIIEREYWAHTERRAA